MVSVCFIDFAPWDYDVSTPTQRPLGGSQSAMCYLAAELARTGHDVAVVTRTSKPGRVMGVDCWSLYGSADRQFDVIVALNSPTHGIALRAQLPSARLVLWTQHATTQPVMRKLEQPAIRGAWDAIVCVSDWQRRSVIEELGVDPARVAVIRNAIAPAFEGLFASAEDLAAAKVGPMRLAYTSAPYRGLEFLPRIFPAFRDAHSDATLEVYSSMSVYMESADEDRGEYGAIYDELAAMAGVEYAGSLPQPELARRLRGAHVLAYPNVFPETSCISAMEAMAAGMLVVTSDLGALPETTSGFGRLVPVDVALDEGSRTIHLGDADSYIAGFTQALLEPYTTAGRLFDQVAHMNRRHTWKVRARQWAEFLGRA